VNRLVLFFIKNILIDGVHIFPFMFPEKNHVRRDATCANRRRHVQRQMALTWSNGALNVTTRFVITECGYAIICRLSPSALPQAGEAIGGLYPNHFLLVLTDMCDKTSPSSLDPFVAVVVVVVTRDDDEEEPGSTEARASVIKAMQFQSSAEEKEIRS